MPEGRGHRSPAKCWPPSRQRRHISASDRASCMRSTGCSNSPSRRTGARGGGRSSGLRPSCSRRRSASSPTQVKALNRQLDRGRPHRHEGQPERQALRQARRQGADRRSLWLRSLAARRPPCGIRCGWRAEARAERDAHAAAAPARDDRPQRHRPDPRDGGRIRLRRRGMDALEAEGRGLARALRKVERPRRWRSASSQPGAAAARGA